MSSPATLLLPPVASAAGGSAASSRVASGSDLSSGPKLSPLIGDPSRKKEVKILLIPSG